MTETTTKRIFAYKICTPVTNLEFDQMNKDVYLRQIFEPFLTEVMNQSVNVKALREEGKFFDINSINQNEDADYLEGVFHTTRYGTQNDIIEITTQAVQGQVLPTQGVKFDVHFVLCRRTGLLLVESDPFRVATRNTIDTYLSKKQTLVKQFIEDYNKENYPQFVYDSMVFTIESVMDQGFYDQLAEISKIKEVSGYMEVTDDGQNAAISKFKNDAAGNEHNVSEVTEFKISLINSVRNSGLKHVKRFIDNSLDLEKFSRFEVSGYDNMNKKRTASFNVKPVSFYVNVDINGNGVINSAQLIQEMVNIAKEDNPLDSEG
jgi:hypothetical protein